MLLPNRVALLPSIRKKICGCRLISLSAFKLNEDRRRDLLSRKLFEELTERAHFDEQLTRIGRSPFEPMLEKPVIVKSFFVSNLDVEDIQYPQFSTMASSDKWKETKAKVSQYFSKHIEYSENGFSPDVYKTFGQMQLFGHNVQKKFGGSELSHTERIFASESETHNIAAAMALNSHRLVCDAITEVGTDEQSSKMLPKLASGQLIGTVAFDEWNPNQRHALDVAADYDDETERWYLRGTKSFVANAGDANLFLVLAKTETHDRIGDKRYSLSVFMVDASLPGVRIHKKDRTIGHRGLNQASVTFDEVELPKDAMLSIPGGGEFIKQRVQMKSRLYQGLINLSQMKSIMQYMTDMAGSIERASSSGTQVHEAKTLRHVIGEYTCAIYALESMLYLTTGIMDKYKNTNVDLETAIFRIYSQDQLLSMTMSLLSFVDERVALSEHPLNEFIRNSIQLKFSEAASELKLHIGTEGIQYRLNRLIEEVKIKNNKEFVIKNFLTPEQLDIYDPEIQPAAKGLYESIHLLRLGTSLLFDRKNEGMAKRHTEITKLADAAALVFATFACLLRFDQLLKTKTPDALDEIAIARTICDKNIAEIKALMQYIEDGPVKTFSKYHEYVTYLLLKKEHQFPAHPLTRQF